MTDKYTTLAIAAVRDVINYNYFDRLDADELNQVLYRMEKELGLIEKAEDEPYTKTMYDQFVKDMLAMNMNLLPTIDGEVRKMDCKWVARYGYMNHTAICRKSGCKYYGENCNLKCKNRE